MAINFFNFEISASFFHDKQIEFMVLRIFVAYFSFIFNQNNVSQLTNYAVSYFMGRN